MNKLLTIGIAYCVVLMACNKKEYEIDNPTYGKTSVEINGQEWKQDIKDISMDDKDRLSFAAFKYKEIDNVYIVFEILSFDHISKTMDPQLVRSWMLGQSGDDNLDATFGTSQDDGDVGCDRFEVFEPDSVNNWIQITKEKDNYKEVWGFYSVTFVRESGCAASPYTDTLRFRNGNFHFRFE